MLPYMHIVSDLSAGKAKRQRHPIAISTSGVQIIIFNTISHQEEPGLLGESIDSKPGPAKNKMILEYFVTSGSKEMLMKTMEAGHRSHLGRASTGQHWGQF